MQLLQFLHIYLFSVVRESLLPIYRVLKNGIKTCRMSLSHILSLFLAYSSTLNPPIITRCIKASSRIIAKIPNFFLALIDFWQVNDMPLR